MYNAQCTSELHSNDMIRHYVYKTTLSRRNFSNATSLLLVALAEMCIYTHMYMYNVHIHTVHEHLHKYMYMYVHVHDYSHVQSIPDSTVSPSAKLQQTFERRTSHIHKFPIECN